VKRPDRRPGETFEEGGWVNIDTPLVKFAFKPELKLALARYDAHATYRASVAFLENIARPEISALEILTVALLLHEQLTYAKAWKQSRGLLRNTKTAPVEELQKLSRIASTKPFGVYFEAFRKSSFYVKNLLAEACGDHIYPYSAARSANVLIQTVDKLLLDPSIKVRQRELELDRCASVLISVFERFTGREPRLANDSTRGRPISALHRFVRDFSSGYGVKLVTDASDGRLDKMLKNRSEFSGDLFALGSDDIESIGYMVYTYKPDLISM
jgi:hypothetical protein